MYGRDRLRANGGGKSLKLERYEYMADILKTLGHPVRLCIVAGLVENPGCNVSDMQQCLEIPQSTISQHLSILRSKGILRGTRSGVNVRYRVVNEDVVRLIKTLLLQDGVLSPQSKRVQK